MANFILLVAEVWLLGLLVLYLHYISGRIGFAPLIFVLGGLTALLQGNFDIYIEPVNGFVLFLGSTVLVPIILMGVLILYVVNGAVPARLTMFSVIGLTTLMALIVSLYRVHLSLPGGGNLWNMSINDAVHPLDLRIFFASTLAFVVDMLVIVITYQGIKNAAPSVPEWVVVGVALMLCLWTDAIIYNMVSDLGKPDLFRFLPGDIIGKSLMALLVWPLASFYLVRIAPRHPGYLGPKNRPTFDLLFGALESVKLQLVRAEAELEHSEDSRRKQAAYFQEVFDHVNEGLWLAAPGRYQLYISPAYARIFGYSAAGLYANPKLFLEAIHPDDKERVLAAMDQQAEGAYDEVYRIIRPDGQVRWVRDRAFPVRDKSDQVYRIAGIVEDITERKTIEQQTIELQIERERVAMLREFIGEASHDLKSPLTAINLKVYLLRHADEDSRRLDLLNEIEQVSSRMNKMIDDLLTLARLEHINERTTVDLDAALLVNEVCTRVRPRAEQKHQTLDFNSSSPTLLVRMVANPDDVTRAVANLVENAVNYTTEGGHITVSARIKNNDLVIAVEDTGIGVEPEDIPRLFDRFFRASNGRRHASEGTGLGLPIVKRVVEQHGGRIEVHSEVGVGTTFTLYLPVEAIAIV